MVPPPAPSNEDSADGEESEESASNHDRPARNGRGELTKWLSTVLILGAFAIVGFESLGMANIDVRTLRTIIGAGVLLAAGPRAIELVVEALANRFL